ncbi:M14-type cytosolic carboxypeptidase [Bryobacter aggregatus]|uniref:M14-type cytosolic carboxypeptidase n=1 Tax=Bryobacter aggregatus TaxID=360054 RepID=UPI0004E201BD|nr:M14-type cytosolic carboxypeptidase [Bryobacter aggregatus]
MWLLLLVAVVGYGADLRVSANFSGGAIGPVQSVSPTHLRVGVPGQTDQDGRNRQASWYYFRVDGAKKGQQIVIDLVDLPGEYNYQKNIGAITGDTRPYWLNGKVWEEAAGDYDPKEPHWRLHFKGTGKPLYVAHLMPYTAKNLDLLRKDLKPEIEVIGKSVEGRKLELWTFDRSGGNPKAPVVWMMFRQHAWEAGTSWTGEGFLRHLPNGVIWKVQPWLDPDGVEHGGVRFNRKGYDLNRNWDSPNDVVLRPEILAQKKAMQDWLGAGKKIDFFLSVHNTEMGEYLEGPKSPLTAKLEKALREKTIFDPSVENPSRMEITGKTRANVAQWLWIEYQVPAHLMELRIGYSQKRKGRANPEVWENFGTQLAREIAGALLGEK